MNLSGKAVTKLRALTDFEASELLVVTDDVWLPLGRLRLRTGGSDGGHNGLKSVAEALGTQGYPRLRIGVGPVPEHEDWADFVLRPFADNLGDQVQGILGEVVNGIDFILARGYSNAQTAINRLPEDESQTAETSQKNSEK
jgi:PTH1 family peptidyl-tRNA hydrolase